MVSSETLRRFSLLAGLEPAFLEGLSALSQSRSIEQEHWLFYEGDKAEALYLIVTGRVELKINIDPKRNTYVTLASLGEGDFFGWSAIVEPYIYSLGAITADSTQLVTFEGNDLRALLEKHPDQATGFMQIIVQTMATRLNTLTQRAPELSMRFVISRTLTGLGIATAILVVILGVVAFASTVNGRVRAGDYILVTLFCLMFPAVCFFIAFLIRPGRSRDVTLGKIQNDATTGFIR